jgi:hypothetical protein
LCVWKHKSLVYHIRLNYATLRLVGGGVQQGPLGTSATHWPIVACPRWLWWWRIWWNEDWQGKQKYSEKTAPAPLCPPQISLDQTRDRTRVCDSWCMKKSARSVKGEDSKQTQVISAGGACNNSRHKTPVSMVTILPSCANYTNLEMGLEWTLITFRT